MAALVAYQMAPAMLRPRPTTFHLAYTKSPKETAPISVIRMFLRLPRRWWSAARCSACTRTWSG